MLVFVSQQQQQRKNCLCLNHNKCHLTSTDVRKECEDLRAQGSDKHAETRLENLRHDLEKQIHDLQNKNKVIKTLRPGKTLTDLLSYRD